jgi:hypothetical protein
MIVRIGVQKHVSDALARTEKPHADGVDRLLRANRNLRVIASARVELERFSYPWRQSRRAAHDRLDIESARERLGLPVDGIGLIYEIDSREFQG